MNYDLAKELANSLEVVRKHHISNDLVINSLANLIHKYDVYDLQLLNETAESLLSVDQKKHQENTIELTPESLLQADIIEKKIRGWVSELRQEVFGSEDIPFIDRDAATEWLKQYAKTQEQIFEIFDKRKDERTFEVTWISINEMHFTYDTPPGLIDKRTKDLADVAGLNQRSLFWHVLINSRLICPAWQITYTSRRISWLPTSMLTIHISYNRRLNSDDTKEIIKRLAREWLYRKSKQTNAKHLELYRLVNEKGMPTGKGKVAFWKEITETWNKRHPGATYSSWKGPSLAYKRLMKNLSKRELLVRDENTANQTQEV